MEHEVRQDSHGILILANNKVYRPDAMCKSYAHAGDNVLITASNDTIRFQGKHGHEIWVVHGEAVDGNTENAWLGWPSDAEAADKNPESWKARLNVQLFRSPNERFNITVENASSLPHAFMGDTDYIKSGVQFMETLDLFREHLSAHDCALFAAYFRRQVLAWHEETKKPHGEAEKLLDELDMHEKIRLEAKGPQVSQTHNAGSLPKRMS